MASSVAKEPTLNICATCGKSFLRKSNLTQHERRHTGGAKYVCCGKHFFSLSTITQHRCSVHGATKHYVCSICSSAFATNAELLRHIRREKRQFIFKCDLGDYQEQDSSKMKDHKSKHNGERKHRCSVCGKTYKYRSGLSAHTTKHHKSD